MKKLISFLIVMTGIFFYTHVFSAEYKCKDAQGKWSSAACSGTATPPKPLKKFELWVPKLGDTAWQVSQYFQEAAADREKLASSGQTISDDRWLNPWYGGPKEQNVTKDAAGTHEQWVFDYAGRHAYLYFDNNVLTSIQE